jgi:hypothetical protein
LQEDLINYANEIIDKNKIFAHFGVGNSGSEKTKNEIKKILDFRQVD